MSTPLEPLVLDWEHPNMNAWLEGTKTLPFYRVRVNVYLRQSAHPKTVGHVQEHMQQHCEVLSMCLARIILVWLYHSCHTEHGWLQAGALEPYLGSAQVEDKGALRERVSHAMMQSAQRLREQYADMKALADERWIQYVEQLEASSVRPKMHLLLEDVLYLIKAQRAWQEAQKLHELTPQAAQRSALRALHGAPVLGSRL